MTEIGKFSASAARNDKSCRFSCAPLGELGNKLLSDVDYVEDASEDRIAAS